MGTDALSNITIGTTATWRATGLSRSQIATLAQSGELVRMRHGVYATAGIVAQARADPGLAHALHVASATATRTHKGAASHHSAARIHGLDLLRNPADGTVTLTVPRGLATGPPAGRALFTMSPNSRTST